MKWTRWFSAVTAAAILTACGAGAPAAEPTAAPDADGVDRSRLAETLYFYNWADYIEPSILESFQQEYGVEVVMDIYDSNEDLLAKLRAGNSGYDLVVPSDYAVQTGISEELFVPLDRSLLTNIGNLNSSLLGLYFDPENTYSLPYHYGTTGIAYNSEVFPDGISSWAVLFDPAQVSQYAGRVSMLDDARETPGAVLKYLGASLNETDPALLEQVAAILTEQKQYLAAYNSSDAYRKLASEEYVLSHIWNGSAMLARTGLGGEFEPNDKIRFVIPDEGGMIFMDNLAIVADSPNAYTAHVFINYLMRPDIAALNADYIGFLTANAAAEPLLSEETQALYAEGFAPDEATLARLEWAVRTDESAAFDELWTRVKGE
jgi:spermidine/putrescine transport system substrate-binding protein